MSAVAQITPQFSPIPSNYNITSANPIQALDITYDDEDPTRQAFHIFLPDSTASYPLVIFIHGGGFTSGSRDIVTNTSVGQATIKSYLDQGIAFASIGYRLLSTTEQDTVGVLKSLNDSKRALQFIRHHATDLFIDASKIALSGISAGAGTCLWLAVRPDMADPDSPDPVEHESTRVCAVETVISQATYDLYKWESEVYNNFDGNGTNFTIDSMVNVLGFPIYSNFYGGLDSNYHILHDTKLVQYRREVDMLYYLSHDDPPLYIKNNSSATHPGDDIYHHYLHAKTLHDAAATANLPELKADITGLSINTTQGETGGQFLIRHLNNCLLTSINHKEEQATRLQIFPNPANTEIVISTSSHLGAIKVEIVTLSGELVLEQQFNKQDTPALDISPLTPGIYLVKITSNNGGLFTEQLIIE